MDDSDRYFPDEVRLFAERRMVDYNHGHPNVAFGGLTSKQRLIMAAWLFFCMFSFRQGYRTRRESDTRRKRFENGILRFLTRYWQAIKNTFIIRTAGAFAR